MNRLRQALEAALPDAANLGGGRNINRDRLLVLLGDLAGELSRDYWKRAILSGFILCLLFAAIWRLAGEPLFLFSALAGLALVLMAALAALKQVTDEIAQLRLVQSLANDVTLETLSEIARKIVLAG